MGTLEDDISKAKDHHLDDSDIDSEGIDSQEKRLKAKRYSSDTSDRKWLAIWAATAVSLWLFGVLFILWNSSCLKISDAVLITLLATTTLNVLGLTYIVLRGHFSSKR